MKVLSAEQSGELVEHAEATDDPLAPLWALALGTGARQGELLGLRWSDLEAEKQLLHIRRSLAHRKHEAESGLESGRPYDLAGFIFSRPDGRPLSGNIVGKTWPWALRRAGLPAVRFHDARHSVATQLLERGMSPRLVADLLGHSNIATTLGTYGHSTASQHEQAAAIMGEILG